MQQDKYQFNNMKSKGFTVIEMLVATAIFLVLIISGTSAIIGAIQSNKKAQTSTIGLSNLSLAIEAMSKNLRLAYTSTNNSFTYTVGSGGSSISFVPSSGVGTITYSFDGVGIIKTVSGGATGTSGYITSPEVFIDSLNFLITDPGNGTVQPKVLIRIKGHMGNSATTQTTFYIQSLVSKRVIPTL
jgi:prepilin-type N-terminal cleavage/methylation domain-containing protein